MNQVLTQSWMLDELLENIASEPVPTVSVTGVCLDSRLVVPGDLYLAVAGAKTHGMQFATAAVAAGAVAVLYSPESMHEYADVVRLLDANKTPMSAVAQLDSHCAAIASRFYREPDSAMTLIAVTGTDGKTSVCRFIAQAFAQVNQVCGYIGTIGWGIGDDLHGTELTTPDAVTLRRILANMRDKGAQYIALEASSHGLAEGRLDGLSLDVAVLTNLGRDHLDYHQSMEAYRAAKAQLFRWPGIKAVVLNGRDAMGQDLLISTSSFERFAFYSSHQSASCVAHSDDSVDDAKTPDSSVIACITADKIHVDDNGIEFLLCEGPESGIVTTSLLGQFNIDNLLACYGSLRACGIAANEARHSLGHVKPVAGRMERFGQTGLPTVVVDFSHTPQALGVAIDAARVHCRGQLWVVFGCGGDRDPGKRAPMAIAAESADHVVLTDDNPRTERSEDIIKAVLAGFKHPDSVTVIPDRASAIEHAVIHARNEDLVLIAGKGHEDYQIVGTKRYSFSDRAEVLAALEKVS